MGVTRFEVHVDELVLEGFPRADRDMVAAAFAQELTRLLLESPTAFAGETTIDDVSGGSPLPATRGPYRLGCALARSVYGALSEAGGEPA